MARFKKPGWTQFPNEIFDQLMPALSGAQFKVVCLIARETAGWHKDREQLSLTQIMGRTGLSRQGAVDSIQYLESQEYIIKGGGVLRSKDSKPEACWYELNVDESEGEEEAKVTVNSVDCSGKVTVNSVDCSTVNSVDCSTVNSVDCSIRSKENKEIVKENIEHNEHVFESENQPLKPDLQLDEETTAFVRNAYRQSRGAKLSSQSEMNRFRIPQRLSECEVSYGIKEFRTELWKFLNESSDWLRQNKWPIMSFLKRMESCGAHSIPTKISPAMHPLANATQQELPGTAAPECPILDIGKISARYHELAPHAPKFILSAKSKPDFPALHDPEFFRDMDAIFEKVESLWVTGRTKNITWLSLFWVLDAKSGLMNWNKLMSGSIDGLCRDESGGRNSTMSQVEVDSLLQRTLKKIKEKGNK